MNVVVAGGLRLRLLNIFSLIIGLFMVAVGLTGLVAPTDLGTIAENATTPAAVWGLAAVVLVMGIVLLRAGAAARIPIVLRAVGVIAIVGAIAMPLVGSQMVTWGVGQGATLIRLTSVVKMAVGAAVAFAANP